MHVLITVFEPLICRTRDAPVALTLFAILQGKVLMYMWQILHASFGKFSNLSNSAISLNWSIINEVTTRNRTAYFWSILYIVSKKVHPFYVCDYSVTC